jgi:hypothetical protein
MIFVREASAAVVLATLTLSLQCTGMAALISFAKPSLAPDDLRLGPLRSALLLLRLSKNCPASWRISASELRSLRRARRSR